MIIERLVAKDFKKHKSIDLLFTSGRNLITGPNYSGKSTVLQAILVGLYGNAMAPGTTQDLVHDDASDFCIELYLSNGVCIKRSAKNSSVTDSSGEVKVRSHSAVNKWCEEVLETDRKTFLKVFASEQGSPQALLSMEGADLQRFIETAAGLWKLDASKKSANLLYASAKTNHKTYSELLLSKDKEKEHVTDLSSYSTSVELNELALSAASENLALFSKELGGLREELQRQVTAESLADSYDKSKTLLDSLLAKLPAPVALVDTSLIKKDLEDSVKRLDAYANSKVKYEKASERVEDTARSLDKKVVERVAMVFPEEVSYDKEESAWELCLEDLTLAEAHVVSLQKGIEGADCSLCHRPFDESRDTGKLEGELSEAKDCLKESHKAKNLAAEKLAKARAGFDVFKGLHIKAGGMDSAITELRTSLKELTEVKASCELTEVQELEGKGAVEVIREKRAILNKLEKDNAKSEEVESQRSELLEQLRSLKEPVREVFDIEGITNSVASVESRVTQLREDESELLVRITEEKAIVKALVKAITSNDDFKKLLAEEAKATINYEAICSALSEAREVAVRDAFTQTLGIASEFVKACTGGDISEVYMGDSGIRYTEQERSRGTVSASGAQKTLIGLGLKLGLGSLVQSPFKALLLDEISADMDDTVSMACLTVMGDYCEQAIVVSHKAMDVADNLIEL